MGRIVFNEWREYYSWDGFFYCYFVWYDVFWVLKMGDVVWVWEIVEVDVYLSKISVLFINVMMDLVVIFFWLELVG